MYVVIIGCGRIGSTIAKELSNEGHDVSVIDKDRDRLDILGSGFNGKRIKGIEYDNDVLIEAGIQYADVFLALTSDDNVNITGAQIAKKVFNVSKVIARICEPNRSSIYKTLEIETISPTKLGAYILKNRVVGKGLEVIASLEDDIDIVEISILKDKFKTIKEIEEKFECIISAVITNGTTKLAKREAYLNIGDKIICTITKKNKEKLMSVVAKEWNI